MKLTPLLAAALVVGACSGQPAPEGKPATAEEAEDPTAVVEAHDSLMRALQAADGVALTALLDDSPDTHLFHPRRMARFAGAAEVRGGFDRMTGRLRDAEWTEVHRAVSVRGDVAWHTSQLAIESPALPEPFLGRATEIWVRRTGGWRLAHAHWSEASP